MVEIPLRVEIWIDPAPVESVSAGSDARDPGAHGGGGIAPLVRERRERAVNAGISWQFDNAPIQRLAVGEPFGRGQPEVLGIFGDKLTDRHLAFLLSVMLEPPLDQTAGWEAVTRRRARVRERLGMTEDGFDKWVGRNLTFQPGRILRWSGRRLFGQGPPRTEGTWWIAAREKAIIPGRAAAEEFIGRSARATALRREDPEALLRAAESARSEDNWSDALDLAEEAACAYWARRRSRADPLWFQTLLTVGGIEMQLGRPCPRPMIATNIERGLRNPRQTLTGTAAQIVRAKAHHLAALMLNQRGGDKERALQELQISLDALTGLSEPEAQHQSWVIRAYEELTNARAAGVAQPQRVSSIWRAISVFCDYGEPWRAEQERMRYGETLLCAGRTVEALQHVERAMASDTLTTAARVIAERIWTVGCWAAERNTKRALARMQSLEESVRKLGFSHQLRTIEEQTALIGQGIFKIA